MKRDNRPWRPVPTAALEWSGDGSPRSTLFGDVYYSRDDGEGESRHVFLQGNRISQRLASRGGSQFCIAETGFGTGLNFLLSWQAWRALPPPRPRLHYLSVEKYPLARDDLARALSGWPALQPLAESLLARYPAPVPGSHRLLLEEGQITLDLWWEDANVTLPDLAARGQPVVDAWYLDGFAPACNRQMWEPGLLRAAALLSRPGATFATFTAAGQVRRDLAAAGFDVEKMPGYGRKRECLRGELARRPAPPAPGVTPWDLIDGTTPVPEHALVLGGGLAGCTTAAALARRGVKVTLLEQDELACGGSGNEQGILYTRLSGRHSTLTDFALLSYCFASRWYSALLQAGRLVRGEDGDLCGSLHLVDDDLDALSGAIEPLPELAQVVDVESAAGLLGVAPVRGGLWFPGSGWLRPASLCRLLARTERVEVMTDCGEIALRYRDGEWEAAGSEAARAPCAVIATGCSAPQQAGLDWLPLQSIRGQTTQLPATGGRESLRAALCHEGYIPPARQGAHCIGATFDLQDDDGSPRATDHRRNLDALGAAVPSWQGGLAALDESRLEGRVGWRCASPDYLPLVGPVPDQRAFLDDFSPLRKNARQVVDRHGTYLPGLYLNTAHGSRGLSSTPLAAEWLASLICHEPPPLDRALGRALAPARFIVRDLARNRI